MSDFELSLKIITLGESGAGKTKLIMRYKDRTYQDINVSTVGVEFQYKIITYNNRPIKLVIYDTSGQEKFRTIVSNYYKNTDGVILVYDISSKKSVSKIQYWVDEIRNNSNNDNNTYTVLYVGIQIGDKTAELPGLLNRGLCKVTPKPITDMDCGVFPGEDDWSGWIEKGLAVKHDCQ